MDGYVDRVVAGKLFAPEVIIQCKSDIGNGAGWYSRHGCLLQSGPGDLLELNPFVGLNVLRVIEIKRHIEAVNIEQETQQGEQQRNK